jgi:carbonic anhydrase
MATSLTINAARRSRRALARASSRASRAWLVLVCVSAVLVASAFARAEAPEPKASAAPKTSASASASAAVTPPPGPPMPADPLGELINGNAAYLRDKPRHVHEDAARRKETAEGQHPFVTVVSCSDSRVPPEILFNQGLGDVFSIRVAGNVVDTDEMGSVEYGVDHLGTPLLVVLGHTKCGAVTAVATHAETHGHIPALLAKVRPAVDATKARFPDLADKDLVPEAIKANVLHTMADLLQSSPGVRERVKAGKLSVVGGVYSISTGAVEWLGKHPEEAAFLAAPEPDEHAAAGPVKLGEKHAKKPTTLGRPAPVKARAEGAEAAPDAHVEGAAPPPPEKPRANFPVGFALVAFLATLGGIVSARMFA